MIFVFSGDSLRALWDSGNSTNSIDFSAIFMAGPASGRGQKPAGKSLWRLSPVPFGKQQIVQL